MYFKALELQGFKSFPQKTRLTFDQAITAVVGPNGSGKSNIADAIRWVMGEQSTKNLRGGKMEDVIFGGTQKRKPMGYAEVSLVLDNTQGRFPLEEQEIMVTRRYYRSGDSEYYINRRSCRLRDIHELFMDTGLGREGYSIIGQGKIDEILSTKSAERRGVFEEAAGISRYRHRKEEAERKLERTEENLLRIGDKIDELELQVGRSVPRRRPPRPTCAVGTSCGFWSCPCGWSSWKGCGTPSESCCPTPSTLPSSVSQRRMLRNSSTPKRRRWGSRCASGSWLWKPCGKRRRR